MISQALISKCYINLAIADDMVRVTFKNSEEGYLFFAKRFASEVSAISNACYEAEEYSEESFIAEFATKIEAISENSEASKLVGKRWFAKKEAVIQLFQILLQIYKEINYEKRL